MSKIGGPEPHQGVRPRGSGSTRRRTPQLQGRLAALASASSAAASRGEPEPTCAHALKLGRIVWCTCVELLGGEQDRCRGRRCGYAELPGKPGEEEP